MAIIGRWKGNSDGQLIDATGNGNDLIVYQTDFVSSIPTGVIDNPATNSPPEGDRWLAYTNNSEHTYPDYNYFIIPEGARPSDNQGYISFYIKHIVPDILTDFQGTTLLYLGSSLNPDVYFRMATAVGGFASGQYRILQFDGSNSAGVGWNGFYLSFADAALLFDGQAHQLVISWSNDNIKIYLDGNLVSLIDAYENPFDGNVDISFGSGSDYTNYGPNMKIFACFGNSYYTDLTETWIDDVVFSNTPYIPFLDQFIDKDPNKIPIGLICTDMNYGDSNLNWSPPLNPTGIISYNVYMAYTKDLVYNKIGSTTGLSYIVSGLERNRDYYFSITSVYSGSYSTDNYIPSGVTAINKSGNIQVSWGPPVNAVSGYRVYRSNHWDNIMIPIATTSNLSYTDRGLDSTLPYYYRVTSVF